MSLILLFIFLMIVFTSSAFAEVTTFYPSVDTWLGEWDPNNTFYSDTNIYVGSLGGGSSTERVMLYFNNIPVGSRFWVKSASLNLYYYNTQSTNTSSVAVSAHSISSNSWYVNQTATWNNFGPGGLFDTTAFASTAVGTTNGYYQWDITNLVRRWLSYDTNQKIVNNGVLLKAVNEAVAEDVAFNSRDSADNRPNLQVDMEQDSTKPSNSTLTSTSHKVQVWNTDNTIDVSVNGASDSQSGVDGYSYNWLTNSVGWADEVKDAEETQMSITSPPLANGKWYFNLRTVDNVGNWPDTATYIGPFYIGTKPVGKIKIYGKLKQVKPGQKITIRGQLVNSANHEQVLRTIALKVRKRVIKKTKTDFQGKFKFKVRVKKTTVFNVVFAGDKVLTSVNKKIKIKVKQ